ncbi:hypothetical protein TL16_g04344 [Triparma laevis f. inornata]|uniref:Uncharacterized protein n=1 Tax=Triparma laevis f. inornata TaxID=1714386 RepID=A0A9W7A5F1_9STRA|nr:hypothetical protein TL16_g04344 [Triparma laevis f. inornata]
MELAIKDLTLANQAAPKDKSIAMKLKDLKFQMKKQKQLDKKQFKGTFNRGEIYQEDEDLKVREAQERQRLEAAKAKLEGVGEEDTLERRIFESEALHKAYLKQGKIKEADELREKIDKALEAKKRMEKRGEKH